MVHIAHTTRSPIPRHDYARIAKDILGDAYELSLVFVGEKRAQALNRQYRGKTYIPNVLSFPIAAHIGEIYICPKVAERQAADFNLSVRGYIAFLFIHGCYHLSGIDHGERMERLEAAALRKYNIR